MGVRLHRLQRARLDDGPRLAGSDRQDGGVRWVDDGGEVLDAEHAEVGHRGGAALVFLRLQLCIVLLKAYNVGRLLQDKIKGYFRGIVHS